MPTRVLTDKSESDVELTLAAIAAHPTFEQASQYLLDAHELRCSPAKLEVYNRKEREKVEALREQLAPRVEAIRANDMLDNVGLATELERVCMERLQQKLEFNEVKDPARVARDLADLKAKNVDKRLAVHGRPTQIVETRNVGEIVKALESLGVAKQVDVEATAIEEGQ